MSNHVHGSGYPDDHLHSCLPVLTCLLQTRSKRSHRPRVKKGVVLARHRRHPCASSSVTCSSSFMTIVMNQCLWLIRIMNKWNPMLSLCLFFHTNACLLSFLLLTDWLSFLSFSLSVQCHSFLHSYRDCCHDNRLQQEYKDNSFVFTQL